MRLEAQKFFVYLAIPITASLAFNEPYVQRVSADYFQFMTYPSNPKTNLKDEYESLKKERDEEIEWEKRMAEKRASGREEHLNQLKLVKQLNVARGGGDVDNTESSQKRGWFGWLGGWRRGSDDNEKDSSGR